MSNWIDRFRTFASYMFNYDRSFLCPRSAQEVQQSLVYLTDTRWLTVTETNQPFFGLVGKRWAVLHENGGRVLGLLRRRTLYGVITWEPVPEGCRIRCRMYPPTLFLVGLAFAGIASLLRMEHYWGLTLWSGFFVFFLFIAYRHLEELTDTLAGVLHRKTSAVLFPLARP